MWRLVTATLVLDQKIYEEYESMITYSEVFMRIPIFVVFIIVIFVIISLTGCVNKEFSEESAITKAFKILPDGLDNDSYIYQNLEKPFKNIRDETNEYEEFFGLEKDSITSEIIMQNMIAQPYKPRIIFLGNFSSDIKEITINRKNGINWTMVKGILISGEELYLKESINNYKDGGVNSIYNIRNMAHFIEELESISPDNAMVFLGKFAFVLKNSPMEYYGGSRKIVEDKQIVTYVFKYSDAESAKSDFNQIKNNSRKIMNIDCNYPLKIYTEDTILKEELIIIKFQSDKCQ